MSQSKYADTPLSAAFVPVRIAADVTVEVLLSVCVSANHYSLNTQTYLTDVLTRLAAEPTPFLPDIWAHQHQPK